MPIYLLGLLMILLSACKESALSEKSHESFFGTWQLTEYLISPGDQGTWVKVEMENAYQITFEPEDRYYFTGRDDCSEGNFYFDKDSGEIFFYCDIHSKTVLLTKNRN